MLQYVGQTTQELRARINNHHSSCSKSNSKKVEGGSIGEHHDMESDEKALVCHMVSVHRNTDDDFMPCIDSLFVREMSPHACWISRNNPGSPSWVPVGQKGLTL